MFVSFGLCFADEKKDCDFGFGYSTVTLRYSGQMNIWRSSKIAKQLDNNKNRCKRLEPKKILLLLLWMRRCRQNARTKCGERARERLYCTLRDFHCSLILSNARSIAPNTSHFLIIHLIGFVCRAVTIVCPFRPSSVRWILFPSFCVTFTIRCCNSNIITASLFFSFSLLYSGRLGIFFCSNRKWCSCMSFMHALSLLFY